MLKSKRFLGIDILVGLLCVLHGITKETRNNLVNRIYLEDKKYKGILRYLKSWKEDYIYYFALGNKIRRTRRTRRKLLLRVEREPEEVGVGLSVGTRSHSV